MTMKEAFYGLLCLASGRSESAGNNRRREDSFPELHLNLWEHGDKIALDVGLLISTGFPSESVYFYFPWAGAIDSIVDLTERINSADSIAAIFNESWAVTQNPRDSTIKVTDPRLGINLFQLVSPRAHWKVDESQSESHRLNISIRELTRRASGSERIYFRFRVNNVPKAFYAVGHSQGDRGLVSSWTRTEFIDFRLNVRCGAPPNLERNVG